MAYPVEGWRELLLLGDPDLVGIRHPDGARVNGGGGR
jgi:hypothetical protein